MLEITLGDHLMDLCISIRLSLLKIITWIVVAFEDAAYIPEAAQRNLIIFGITPRVRLYNIENGKK